MSSGESFHFDAVDLLTVGALGPKGQRVFYLQCAAEGSLVSLKFEKFQAAALADYLDKVLKELPPMEAGEPPGDLDMREPVIEAWTIGALGIAYDESDNRVILIAEELVEDKDEDEGDDNDEERASARFTLTRAQVAALIARTRSVVEAGRSPCPYCMRPLEPSDNGWCPCHN